MTLGDIILFVSFGLACFFFGRASMMHTIIRAVTEEAENEKSAIIGTGDPGELTIEKINNVYYAYVGPDFAGQADNFDDLISNMGKDRRFGKFKIAGAKNLSADEQNDLAQALQKNYNLK